MHSSSVLDAVYQVFTAFARSPKLAGRRCTRPECGACAGLPA